MADTVSRLNSALEGRYRIVGKLGEGGMGVVYLAEDLKLGRRVALKFLPADVAGDETARARFSREAKTAAALDHPFICHIHETGEVDGNVFIAMEYVDGTTLRERLADGRLPLTDALTLAREVAEALSAAHESGIIHRDIKPSNIMLTARGHAKVMDFGLAKALPRERFDEDRSGLTMETAAGLTPGTLAYMSPEQIAAEPADARSDIFGFGVVLYEALTGKHPLRQKTSIATAGAILAQAAPSLRNELPDAPAALVSLLAGMLERDRTRRTRSARAVLAALEAISGAAGPARPRARRRAIIGLVGATGTALFAIVLFTYRARLGAERARASIPEVERLAQAGQYVAAYELAESALGYLPGDSALAQWLPMITDRLTIITEPTGASVTIERFAPDDHGRVGERRLIGTTPIVDLELARAEYRASIEKEGFVTLERMISSELNRAEARLGASPDIRIEDRLSAVGVAPNGMVHVPGGEYRLVSWAFADTDPAVLDDFFIDRYEVTNEEYREFIRAGGYSNESFWTRPFVSDGTELSFDEAMALFTDRSGLPGPREWLNQEFREGQARHPVTGVSWYEATAFAEYAGKALPTIFQWEKAARAGRYTHFEGIVMPWGLMHLETSESRRANFYGRGAVPVDSLGFGLSPFGAYNMAGNVAEWTLNERGAGRATAGGSWTDASYVFTAGESRPALDAADNVGFRLVSRPGPGREAQGTLRLVRAADTTSVVPVDDAVFETFLSHYRYDRGELGAEVVETIETPDWTRERITFNGVGGDRAIAYLYLPSRGQAPFQTISWVVSATAFYGRTTAAEVEALLAPQIKSGRAVLAVVPRGAIERPWPGHGTFPAADRRGTVEARDELVLRVTEFRMGLDYLETRPEIDTSRIAHGGFSWGAWYVAIILNAVEPRIRSAFFIGGGVGTTATQYLPEANAQNFAPRMHHPTLLLTGRFDEETPYDPFVRLLFELLPGPKRLELVESGHLPPLEIRSPIIDAWLDETLGPVTR